MAEVKNTFLKGKMNKDVDARILPKGEYRDAQNVLIGKSDASDVGVLQTLKGNIKADDSVTDNGTVIGYFAEQETQTDGSNRIFYFVAGDAPANNAIYFYDTSNPTGTNPKVIVSGAFLNFSANNLITGVNMIDDLLFFTDNNNQPRKINVAKAISDPSFYNDEIKIAVAKYYPYLAPEVLTEHDQAFTGDGSDTTFDLTTAGGFPTLPSAKSQIEVFVNGQLINTSNYNYSSPTVTFTGNTGNTSQLESSGAPKNTLGIVVKAKVTTGIQLSKTTAVGSTSGSSTTVTLTAANNNIFPGQTITGSGITAGTTVSAIAGQTLTMSAAASLSGVTLTFESTKDFLEEKFIRFAYRYKFKDNEYSLISPFTQHCFIPKIYNGSLGTDYDDDGLTDNQIKKIKKSAENEDMINDAVNVTLQLHLPSATSFTDFEIEEIEILFKESDSPAIKSVGKVALTADNELGSNHTFVYKSNLPFKTLAEDQTTRTYDNIPLKAKAQELTGNRLIYGNFEINQDIPSIDFEAGVQQRTNAVQKYHLQYPYHTIKQRRTYQVGLVLADYWGRQSSVILPVDKNKSAVKVSAKDNNFNTQSWNGDGLTITFNEQIPNVYNASTNKFGWYSYKVVIKQIEQEYHTVYAPLAVDGFPNASTPDGSQIGSATYSDEDKRTWISLHGDNINKIPRDIKTNVQEEGISRSLTDLFPKVKSVATTGLGAANGMSNDPLTEVISIGTYRQQGLMSVANASGGGATGNAFTEPYKGFYLSSKNLLCAELKDGLGAIDASGSGTFNSGTDGLSVWETQPFESALDIYYETSTSGKIEELNAEIVAGSGGPANLKIDGSETDSFAEGVSTPHNIGALTAHDSNGSQLSNITFELISAFAQSDSNTPITSRFDINGTNLRVISEKFYFDTSGDTIDVTIKATDNSSNTHTETIPISLTNSACIFTNLPGTATPAHYKVGEIFDVNAENGSHDDTTPQDTLGLTFSIYEVRENPSGSNTDVTSSNLFTINSTTGVISNTAFFAVNKIGTVYRVKVRVLDASNDTAFKAESHVDITISPLSTAALLNSNFGALCTTTTTTQFFVTKSAQSTSDTFEEGDIVYTTFNSGTLSNTFGGYIITATSGGEFGDGVYVRVVGGAAGEVMDINVSRDCSV